MLDLHCCAGFSLVVMKVSHSVVPRLYSPWNSPDQNTGEGSLSLLQGIFSTQGLNPGLLHCPQILYQMSHQGSPRMLEWVAYSFCSRSSQPRNWTGFSCIAGGFFTNWTIREVFKRPMQEKTKEISHPSKTSVWFDLILIFIYYIFLNRIEPRQFYSPL